MVDLGEQKERKKAHQHLVSGGWLLHPERGRAIHSNISIDFLRSFAQQHSRDIGTHHCGLFWGDVGLDGVEQRFSSDSGTVLDDAAHARLGASAIPEIYSHAPAYPPMFPL